MTTRAEPRGRSIPPRPKTDRFLQWLSRRVMQFFYRRIEVVGLHNLPVRGPVIVVANHTNSLVDGTMVTGFLPRIPRLVAASIVWAYTPLIPFIKMAGVIPIFRQAETRNAAEKNLDTFAAAVDVLAAGGMIAVFPEGESHDELGLKPFKSGTARLALQAQDAVPFPGVHVLPVGLSYEAKGHFRSRALMEIGSPISVADYQGDPSTRPLTQSIRQGLQDVTQSFRSLEQSRLIKLAAILWEDRNPGLADQPDLVGTTERQRDFIQRFDWLSENHPSRTSEAWDACSAYYTGLQRIGLEDRHVGAQAKKREWLKHLAMSGVKVLMRLPVALLGFMLSAIPLVVIQLLSLRQDADKKATWQVFPALILSPIYWIAQGVVVGGLFGFGSGILTFLLAPATLPVTLGFIDRMMQLRRDFRAWRKLVLHPTLAQRLHDLRRRTVSHLDGLADLVEDMPDPNA